VERKSLSSERVIKSSASFRFKSEPKKVVRPYRIIPRDLVREVRQTAKISGPASHYGKIRHLTALELPPTAGESPARARKGQIAAYDQSLIDQLVHERMNQIQDKLQRDHEQAFKEGYDQGKIKGFQEGQAISQRLESFLESMTAELSAWKEKFLVNAEANMARMSFDIAETIIGHAAMNCSREALEHNLKRCLEVLKGSGRVKIRINPADFEFVKDNARILEKGSDSRFAFEFEPDSAILPGGCYLESPQGAVDGRLESQLDLMKDALSLLV
jgi:flagellar assembly protein FliH